MQIQPEDVIDFWYSDEMKPHWFRSTDGIDQALRQKFYSLWLEAEQGQLNHWMNSPLSCVALVIVLDQLPLNMLRGQPRSFATEARAITITKHAVSLSYDDLLEPQYLAFLYMPLMHSENMSDQDQAVALFAQAGLEANLRFSKHHRGIVERFGRFPHRNAILGRVSTEAEISYLDSADSFKG